LKNLAKKFFSYLPYFFFFYRKTGKIFFYKISDISKFPIFLPKNFSCGIVPPLLHGKKPIYKGGYEGGGGGYSAAGGMYIGNGGDKKKGRGIIPYLSFR
jgi:hypothetical protein